MFLYAILGYLKEVPSIVTMLRGILKEEIIITGPDKDLHSGMYGGISTNPARVLTNVLSALHNHEGIVTIPGFYDEVSELPKNIKDQWDGLNFNNDQFLRDVGLSTPAGEKGRTPLEMIWSRPTCEINGIKSGYINEGFKTVLPSQASAKISFRLVVNQDPLKIRKSFREMVENLIPIDCKVNFLEHEASKASQMDTSSPEFEKARAAISEEWGTEAAFVGCGGSIPIAGHFQQITGVDPMLIGFAKDDDQIHSPNEKYDLESFRKGIRSWVRVINSFLSCKMFDDFDLSNAKVNGVEINFRIKNNHNASENAILFLHDFRKPCNVGRNSRQFSRQLSYYLFRSKRYGNSKSLRVLKILVLDIW